MNQAYQAYHVRHAMCRIILDHPNRANVQKAGSYVEIQDDKGEWWRVLVYQKKNKIKCWIYGGKKDFKPDVKIYETRTKNRYSCTLTLRIGNEDEMAYKILEWMISSVSATFKCVGEVLIYRKIYELDEAEVKDSEPPCISDITDLKLMTTDGLDKPNSKLKVVCNLSTAMEQVSSYVEVDIRRDKILKDGKIFKILNHREVMDAIIEAVKSYEPD